MVFTNFKRGSRSTVNNPRGLRSVNTITNLNDMILCDGLRQQFSLPQSKQLVRLDRAAYRNEEHIEITFHLFIFH